MRQEHRRCPRAAAGVGASLVTVLLAVLSACAPATAQRVAGAEGAGAGRSTNARPSLIVYVVVDQLRGDLLDRYDSLFTEGFRRLLDSGLVFTHALHDHSATETSPGHTALSTAVVPARAGIPANAWREGEGDQTRSVFNVIDREERLVGLPRAAGASPRVLRRQGLADWIQAADSTSRVVSISAKPRAAVLMAAHSRAGVYWYHAPAGRFVTSTYYTDTNPAWLERFNAEVMPTFRADSVWTSTIPPGAEGLSAPDTAAFEGDGVHTFFPHRYWQERVDTARDDFYLWFEGTPMLDRATLELALVAMREEGLGTQPGRTDFLSVSFSQTDRVGHPYGPLSREQMDNLLRLDRTLGRLLDYLDEHVGPGRYVLGLTGDHGVVTMPERRPEGGLRLASEHRSQLEEALGEAARRGQREGARDLAPFMAEAVRQLPFVGPAYPQSELDSEAADSMAVLFRHSFVPGRPAGLLSRFGVEMWWAEGVVDWEYTLHGTTHGSPYYYDRWVPLILLAPGVDPGRVEDPVTPMDLAPTLAELAGVAFPDDLDGKPLLGGR